MSYSIRPIQQEDNPLVAAIIRTVMTEFGAVGSGFSIMDPEVDQMFEAYAIPKAAYFVLEKNGEVLGGGGIAPLMGGMAEIAELKKMYFQPALRGLGLGRQLIELLESRAKEFGFHQLYIETLRSMSAANRLYQASGFRPLEHPLGNTGHTGCDLFYQKIL
jgi:putative acetyltransferase